MAVNTSFEFFCQDWYKTYGEKLNLIVYWIIFPIYTSISFFGHLLCIYIYYKQSKTEPAYFYQVVLSVHGIWQSILYIPCIIDIIYNWSSIDTITWYRKNYILMWFSSHLSLPLFDIAYTTNQLLVLTMTIDRIFAISRPLRYKQINQKKYIKILSIIFCIFLSISTGLCECFNYLDPIIIELNNYNFYIINPNIDFLETKLYQILEYSRNIFRIAIVVILIFLNTALVILFQKKNKKKLNKPISKNSAILESEKQKVETEKRMLRLIVIQLIFALISSTATESFYIIHLVEPGFDECEGQF